MIHRTIIFVSIILLSHSLNGQNNVTHKTDSTNNLFITLFNQAAIAEDTDQLKSLFKRFNIGKAEDGNTQKFYYVHKSNKSYVSTTSTFKNLFGNNIVDRGYNSKGSALFTYTADNFLGSLLSGALVGGIATLFADDKGRAFLYWSVPTFVLTFVLKQPRFSSFEHKSAIRYAGKWLPLSDIHSEANTLQKAYKINDIRNYENFLYTYPGGIPSPFVKGKIAYLKKEWSDFQEAENSATVEAYDNFLKRYPASRFKAQILAKRDELIFAQVKREDTINAYADFLARYPDSKFRQEAFARKAKLAFDIAREKDTIEAYQTFLFSNSTSEYADSAWAIIGDKQEMEFYEIDPENIAALQAFVGKYPDARISRDARQMIENKVVADLRKRGFHRQFVIRDIQSEEGPDIVRGNKTFFQISPGGQSILDMNKYADDGMTFRGASMWTGNTEMSEIRATAAGSIWRFVGKAYYKDYVFEGKSLIDPLSFMFVQNRGFVYIHGHGEVTLKDGRKVVFPRK